MCIYYKDHTNLTYDSQEHIIPAGLGGNKKLPKEYVSSQFNNAISALELDFLRNSIISINRQLIGPGKRGKLSDKNATKSKVHVLFHPDGYYGLAFVKKSRQYIIPHVVLNTTSKEVSIGFHNDPDKDVYQLVPDFASKCETPDALKTRIIICNALPINIILFGIEHNVENNFNAFIAKNPECPVELTDDVVKLIGNGLLNCNTEPQIIRDKPKSNLSVIWKEEFFRLYAKMGFNLLADCMGYEFVRHERFDKIRNYIASGGPNTFAQLFPDEKVNFSGSFNISVPDDSHIILLMQDALCIYALVSLYNNSVVRILLTDNYEHNFNSDGIICDWKTHTEQSLEVFIAQKAAEICQKHQPNKEI